MLIATNMDYGKKIFKYFKNPRKLGFFIFLYLHFLAFLQYINITVNKNKIPSIIAKTIIAASAPKTVYAIAALISPPITKKNKTARIIATKLKHPKFLHFLFAS